MEGLLHLGAVSALAGAVYLNLDKAALEHSAWSRALEELREDIKKAITVADQSPTMSSGGKIVPSPSFRSTEAGFLLYIAGEDCKHYRGFLGFSLGCKKIRRAPGLNYFMKGWHTWPVGILTTISWILFLSLVAISTKGWHLEYWIGIDWPWVHFWVYTLTALSVLASSSISHILLKLSEHCMSLMDRLRNQIEADVAAVSKKSTDVIDAADSTIGAAPEQG